MDVDTAGMSCSDTLGSHGVLAHGGWPTYQVCGLEVASCPILHLLGDRTTGVSSLYLTLETPGSGDKSPAPSETAAADLPPRGSLWGLTQEGDSAAQLSLNGPRYHRRTPPAARPSSITDPQPILTTPVGSHRI